MALWIILAVVAAALVYVAVAFNRLVRTRQMANEAWSGIDVQLKRRSELVPNLVDTVKGYAAHERSVLEEVTQLRGAARAVPAGDVAARAQAEGALSAALGKLFALAENYPDLKASNNFLDLQQQLSSLENELQMARRYYNGTVRNLNVLVQSFPSNLIAGLFGFGTRAFFQLGEGEGAVPQVDLTPARRMRSRACRQQRSCGMVARRWRSLALSARRRLAPRPKSSIPSTSDVAVAKDGELTVTETSACAPSTAPSATASFATSRSISAGAAATCTK